MWSCFWLKPSGKLATYHWNIKLAIDDWVEHYNRNWYTVKNAEDMINRCWYCKSRDTGGNIIPWWCEDVNSNWKKSFNSFIWFIQ